LLNTATYSIRNKSKNSKTYELTNHLGNVMSTISDRKIPVGSTITHFLPDVDTYQDYFPFGMVMSERSGSESSAEYRYGFNGMEYEDELYQPGNAYDFGARVYDGRIGRWFSVDPLAAKQPGWSTYKFGLNNPLVFIDPSGETEFYFNGKWIGTDGQDNDLIAVVESNKVKRQIKKNTRKGHFSDPVNITKAAERKDGMLIIHKSVLIESLRVLERAKTPKGETHEFGNTMVKIGNEFFRTGPIVEGLGDGMGLPNFGGLAGKLDVSIHSHRTWHMEGTDQYIPLHASEDKDDLPGDQSAFEHFEVNIIVGKMGEISQNLVPDNLTGVYNSEYSDDRIFGMYIYLNGYEAKPSKRISENALNDLLEQGENSEKNKKKKQSFNKKSNGS